MTKDNIKIWKEGDVMVVECGFSELPKGARKRIVTRMNEGRMALALYSPLADIVYLLRGLPRGVRAKALRHELSHARDRWPLAALVVVEKLTLGRIKGTRIYERVVNHFESHARDAEGGGEEEGLLRFCFALSKDITEYERGGAGASARCDTHNKNQGRKKAMYRGRK